MKPLEKIACLAVAGLYAGHLIQQWMRHRDDRWCRMAAGESRYERAQSPPMRKRRRSSNYANGQCRAELVHSTV